MKRATILTGALVLALTATSMPAFAHDRGEMRQKGPRGPVMNFEQIDTDSDGKITQAELDAHAAARFTEADTDGDGKLSADEMLARMQARAAEREEQRAGQKAERMSKGAARMIERRDTDGDGFLSAEEMKPKNGGDIFAKLDTDEDGAITKEEMEAAREKFQDRRGEGKRHGRDGDHERGGQGKRWMKHQDNN